MKRRVLLVASTTGYQTRMFAEAAGRIGVDLVLATDRCHILENPWGDDAAPIRFDDPAAGIDTLVSRGPFHGVVGVGDKPAYVAAQAAARLGLPFSSPASVLAAKNKFLARERFRAAGLPVPRYHLVSLTRDPEQAALDARYPCVLKPLTLSASRGVIRANDPREFVAAFSRIKAILADEHEHGVQVEDFIPGREYALEGVVTRGRLQVLALFDKPDPLDGPFFEETIYLTPSREPVDIQNAIFEASQGAVTALGLTDGPVHAEMRVNEGRVWMLEVAPRPIGGLCAQVIIFEQDMTLEDVLLRHAVGEDVSGVALAPGAHGVMMIPIPAAGVYTGVDGLDDARQIEGVEEVIITAKVGQRIIPLPEGASYLGFIFARGPSQDCVEQALRKANVCLKIHLSQALPVVR